jgi:hypothetical protein
MLEPVAKCEFSGFVPLEVTEPVPYLDVLLLTWNNVHSIRMIDYLDDLWLVSVSVVTYEHICLFIKELN